MFICQCLTESHVQMFTEEGLSKTLLSIVDKDYSLVIQVREMNVVNNFNVYWANNICKGFVGLPGATNQSANAKDAQTSQVLHCCPENNQFYSLSFTNLHNFSICNSQQLQPTMLEVSRTST